MVAAERVSEPLSLFPILMQLVMQEDFLSHVVAASKEYNLEIATKDEDVCYASK